MQAGTPSSIEMPTKSSGNTDQGLMKKLKGFDGLAMSIGNCNAESAEHGAENRLSQRYVDPFPFFHGDYQSIVNCTSSLSLVHELVILLCSCG